MNLTDNYLRTDIIFIYRKKVNFVERIIEINNTNLDLVLFLTMTNRFMVTMASTINMLRHV